jgi:hypothetical protein
MVNRRELLATTIALSLAARAQGASGPSASGPAASGPAASSVSPGGPAAPHFIAATDLVEARAAAQAAAASGAEVVWLGSDLTPVYAWLDTSLRRAPFTVAGLTTSHDFFIIERLAFDRGLRAVQRTGLGTALAWRLEPRPGKKGSDPFFGA